MSNEIPKNPTNHPNSDNSPWDSLSNVKFSGERKSFRDSALEDAEFYAKDIKETEKTFSNRLKTLKSEGKSFMPRKEFEVWEDDLSDRWSKVASGLEKSGIIHDRFAAAKIEDNMIPPQYRGQDNPNVSLTIEAQSGYYFAGRYTQLLKAISNTSPEKKAEAEAILKHFNESVETHLDYKYMSPDERASFSGQQYWAERSRAHNEVIETLNKMNSLAEELRTRRFTPRNFWSGDYAPDKSRRTPEVEDRIQYDRGIVEAYYDYAFSSDIARREAKLNRGY